MLQKESVLVKNSPAQEMAEMVFNSFGYHEQVEIAKDFLRILVEKRQERYEALINDSLSLDARAKEIAVGSQQLSQ